jgi:2-dehydro-3-deoxygalactonokinase
MSPIGKDKAAFIAVDWGTSNARFALCDENGRPLELRKGPGVVQSRGRFPEVFAEHTRGWDQDLPAMLCGMAGGNIGWLEAPYLPCPAELDELADELVRIRDGVHVVRGMRCTNPLGAPDVMRGEETQLLGCCELHPGLARGRHLACLPGTHTKWVSVSEGVVQEFLTAPTGEMFAMLCDHTVMVRDQATPMAHVPADFERGLAEAARHPGALLHQVFQARSLRLDRQLGAEGAASWMSGLLIGADVGGALTLFGAGKHSPVYVIGTPELTSSYDAALTRRGYRSIVVDGSAASLAGLARVYRDSESQRA